MTATATTAIAIAAARRCLGTPFHHQGRLPGVGLDCIGLVIVALTAAGLAVRDRADYARRPERGALTLALTGHGAVKTDMIRAGDVLLFSYDGQPQHAALATGPAAMIHSFAPAGRVIETPLGAAWLRRLDGIYRFPFFN